MCIGTVPKTCNKSFPAGTAIVRDREKLVPPAFESKIVGWITVCGRSGALLPIIGTFDARSLEVISAILVDVGVALLP